MHEYQILTILAAFAFFYSLIASRLEKTPINGALVYVVAGALCGPAVLGLVELHIHAEGIRWLAELTLGLVLFTDSANANLTTLRKFEAIPARLLLIGLPLTILLGFGVGFAFFPNLGFFEIALLATMLAPTDAALGKPVVTNKSVPDSVRESLNVESGLNDGICVPVILLFLSLAKGEASGWETVELAAVLPVEAIGIGAAIGVGLGFLGSAALRLSSDQGWTSGTWLQLPVAALALLCFASAQWLGGSGFIASFVGGMTFGAFTRDHKRGVLEAAEGSGDAMALLTWFVFGAVLFALPLKAPDWRVVGYAVASLTVIRMLPVFLCIGGLRLRTDTKLFLGWFGPRGLASIVFAVMVMDSRLPGGNTLAATAAWTIVLSVLAHGLSANPLARRYGARVGDSGI